MRNFLDAMDAAYDRGVADFNRITYTKNEKIVKAIVCPYEKDSAEGHQWDCGFNDAKKEKENPKK